MKQKVRKQYRLLVIKLAIAGATSVGLSYYFSPLWLLALIAVVLYARQQLMDMQCEACHDPLLYRVHQLFGFDVTAWWPTLPKHCQTCEHPVAG